MRKLEREAPGPVRMCYEAGPCGYALQRQLTARRGQVRQVIAPALMPRKPGERIKTDRRDARKLAELLRAGLLTEVRPPTPAEEAVRDLCRPAMTRVKICSARAIALANCCFVGACTFQGAELDEGASAMDRQRSMDEHAAERVVVDDYLLAIEQLESAAG